MVDRVSSEPGEKLGMRRRVGRVHLVERHHQPAAIEPVPEAVDDGTGEEVAVARLEARASTSLARALNFGAGGGTLAFKARSSSSFSFLCWSSFEALSQARRPSGRSRT